MTNKFYTHQVSLGDEHKMCEDSHAQLLGKVRHILHNRGENVNSANREHIKLKIGRLAENETVHQQIKSYLLAAAAAVISAGLRLTERSPERASTLSRSHSQSSNAAASFPRASNFVKNV